MSATVEQMRIALIEDDRKPPVNTVLTHRHL